MNNDKRGITNIEMIIAATIFIFSVILVIYYINIVGIRTQTQDVFLDTLEKEIRNKAEISYNIIYLSVSSSEECYNMQLHSDMSNKENFSFINEINGAVNFNISDDRLLIERINLNEHKYTIFSFPFTVTKATRITNNINCSTGLVKGQEYNYSISYKDKIFVYENLSKLNNSYHFHYPTLKNEMGLNNTDFAITIFNSTDILFNMTRFKPQVQISAREFPIKIINDNGEIREAVVNIQVW